jgi:hypothetical protein
LRGHPLRSARIYKVRPSPSTDRSRISTVRMINISKPPKASVQPSTSQLPLLTINCSPNLTSKPNSAQRQRLQHGLRKKTCPVYTYGCPLHSCCPSASLPSIREGPPSSSSNRSHSFSIKHHCMLSPQTVIQQPYTQPNR